MRSRSSQQSSGDTDARACGTLAARALAEHQPSPAPGPVNCEFTQHNSVRLTWVIWLWLVAVKNPHRHGVTPGGQGASRPGRDSASQGEQECPSASQSTSRLLDPRIRPAMVEAEFRNIQTTCPGTVLPWGCNGDSRRPSSCGSAPA